jgi:hypothetical protein
MNPPAVSAATAGDVCAFVVQTFTWNWVPSGAPVAS